VNDNGAGIFHVAVREGIENNLLHVRHKH
jgi:hypothetical protein